MPGAFIVSRDIFENPIWQNNTEFRLFFLIMGKAIHTEEGTEIGNIQIKKGQWLRSYRNLQNDMEYIENNAVKKPSLSTIKRTVDKLVADKRITIELTELGTLFTVVNYCKYQDLKTYKKKSRNDAENSVGTQMEQPRNNNNNVNNDKNDKSIYSIFKHWNSKKIVVHKELTQAMSSCINARLEAGNTIEEITEAIDNYEKILTGEEWFWSYKWGMTDFLKKGLDKFRTENDPFKNHEKPKPIPNKNKSSDLFSGINEWAERQGLFNEQN